MGVYSGANIVTEDAGVVDMDVLKESLVYAEIASMPEEARKAFIESAECKAMEEAGIIGRQTIVRLSKMDDLTRRIKIASFQIAKEKKDPLWSLLVRNRIKERELIGKLVGKYGTGARRSAIQGQRELLKVTPNAFTRPIGR